jgi:hypothetical protein
MISYQQLLVGLVVVAGLVFAYVIATRNRGTRTDVGAIGTTNGLSPEPPDADGSSEVSGIVVQELQGGGVSIRRYRPSRSNQPQGQTQPVQDGGNDGGQQQVNGGQQGQQGQQALPAHDAPAVPNFNVAPGQNAGQMIVTFPGGAPQAQFIMVQIAPQGTQNWGNPVTIAPAATLTIGNITPAGLKDVRVAVIDAQRQMSQWSAAQQVNVVAPA